MQSRNILEEALKKISPRTKHYVIANRKKVAKYMKEAQECATSNGGLKKCWALRNH